MEFKLNEEFVKEYSTKPVNFGFNGLGEITYYRTYSRLKLDGTNEKWHETIERVVNGIYSIQKEHILKQDLGWNENKAQSSAQEMYDRMFKFKFLSPGRGLWACGTDIVKKGLGAALNNCAFVSTGNIDKDFTKPFCFMMDVSMLGVGVGFDLKGEGKVEIHKSKEKASIKFKIPDSREGWVESLKLLLNSYIVGALPYEFDYSDIRLEGTPIKTFGGISSGPQPLIDLHNQLRAILDTLDGKLITSTAIADIMNLIGVSVVSGNVRRSAQLILGNPNSEEFINLKNYKLNPRRLPHGWASNNSVNCNANTDFSKPASKTAINGEPGYFFLENAQKYGRLIDVENNKDKKALGTNPCQPSWAKIITKEGLSTIGELKEGELIWSETGWTKVIKKWSTGVKKVMKYETTSGVFYGTENHKLLSNKVKTEAKDCKKIDSLRGHFEELVLNPQDVIDGMIVGDGSMHKASNNKITLMVGKKDTDYFSSEVKDFIGNKSSISKYSFEVKTTIKSLKLTYDRQIPQEFFKDKARMAGFLRGLFTANGTFTGNRVSLKTSSSKLREEVQLALSWLGINSYFTTNKEKSIKFTNGDYVCKESYDVNISNDCYRFSQLIGFIQKYKTTKLINYLSSIKTKYKHEFHTKAYPVKNIKFISEEEVFDITVDNETHTYWTGGLNVSNCGEQTLEDMELCCLVETFPDNHDSLEDYLVTLKYAYLYAKSVTLLKTHWKETNRVLLRNRRIGLSQTGIAQFLETHSLEEYRIWCEEGYKKVQYYDEIYSNWFCIPRSIKTTSIKPSGSISLLAGATPGMHYAERDFYIRRIRISNISPLLKACKKAGYKVEQDIKDKSSSCVEIPVKVKCRTVDKVSIWEQVALAVFIQKHWADNQVSCTVTFKPEEAKEIEPILKYNNYNLKGISFLPKTEQGAYDQMPYEAITEEEYEKRIKGIKPLDINLSEDSKPEQFCDGDKCLLV